MRPRGDRRESRGQALVEFSLVLIPFVLLLLGVFDLGRAVYINNGVSQAAREIARVTSVHTCSGSPCTLGTSPETQEVIATQRALVPGLADPAASVVFQCTDIADTALSNTDCEPGSYVRVTVNVPFSVITPVLGMVAPTTLSSTSHVLIP